MALILRLFWGVYNNLMNNPMKNLLAIVVLLAVVHATVVPHVGPIDTHVPLTFKVQIDQSPLTRWEPIIRTFNHTLHRFIQFVELLPIPKGFYDGVEWYAKNEFVHQDFVKEVDAVATLSQLPFEKIFFLNFMYEYSTFAACTGLLVSTPEGKVIHGRNLDFEMWELFSKLLTNVQYYRGDKLIFSSDIVVGSVFALTGIRPGSFAVNCDTRYAKHFVDDLISVLKDNAIPTLWLLRKVLAEETNYTTAVKRLKTERVGGPVYFIVSGTQANEGTVIERDTDSVHAAYELSDSNWFLIQTNYDRDQPDPIHDPRRVPVENRMKERGNKGINEQVLFDSFMSQWPTFNIATIMTVIMVPATGYRNTTVWYGSNPENEQETATQ